MQQKNNPGTIILTVIITAVLVGGGVYYWSQKKVVQEEVSENSITTTEKANQEVQVEPKSEPVEVKEVAKEPLSYSLNGVSGVVSKKTMPFDYTSEQLFSMAQECGSNKTESYFANLITQFNGVSKTLYNFKYTEASQDPDTFVVTLLPNKAGYTSLDQFKKDFDQCYAAGDAYPTMLNKDWLLFVNSCGSGYSDDSGRPIGCQLVSDKVQPTLKLN